MDPSLSVLVGSVITAGAFISAAMLLWDRIKVGLGIADLETRVRSLEDRVTALTSKAEALDRDLTHKSELLQVGITHLSEEVDKLPSRIVQKGPSSGARGRG